MIKVILRLYNINRILQKKKKRMIKNTIHLYKNNFTYGFIKFRLSQYHTIWNSQKLFKFLFKKEKKLLIIIFLILIN